jgi:multiple sugar transport system substrate-binding protein
MQEEYFSRQKESIPAFADQTGIDVTIDLLAIDLALNDPFLQEARTAFDDPPTWDLLAPDEGTIAANMGHGLVEPLGEYIRRDDFDIQDFLPAALDCYSSGGEVYAVPYVTMSNVLIYRKDILDRYGLSVPDTWDELREVALAAQTALRRDGIEDVIGFTSRGLAGYGHNFWIVGSTMFPSWGWEWDQGESAPPRVYEPATVDALAFYVALLREAGPAEAATMTFIQTHQYYASGKAVFLLDAATELAVMRREGPNSAGHVSAVTLVPTGPTGRREPGLYCPGFCIPRSSLVKEEAWQLLRFLASYEECLKDAVEAGYAETARESAIASDAFSATVDTNFINVLRQTRAVARANRPRVKHYFELGDIVGAAAASVIVGERGADEALRSAQRDLDLLDWR